ncbi:hypothetical protein [Streptomyces sp. TRM68367]|uniref:hypothetical protein n=1 Tax=Streptomyces sp. TRM68367 TaxID=2758415 RepID=UPI00165B2F4D|nr:hypothetical protein [Streptomyces sp. TRM68367]MBC9729311.1 hypothetical protein [Streptomyces sp. TRM68367]
MPASLLHRRTGPGAADEPALHHPHRHGHGMRRTPAATPPLPTRPARSREDAMRDTFAPHRARRLGPALVVLLAAAAIMAITLMAHGVPDAWWPQTGDAFTTTATSAARTAGTGSASDPCDLIVGPAHDYCQRGADSTAPSAGGGSTSTGVLLLIPALLGIGVLLRLRWSRP